MFFILTVALFLLAWFVQAPGWLIFGLGVLVVFGLLWRIALSLGIVAAFLAGWRGKGRW